MSDDYQSGPFCRHWSDGCDALCACGHACGAHNWSSTLECREEGCECDEFRDAPESAVTDSA